MPASSGTKPILWVESLRGIVSVLVLVTHVARAWDYSLFLPQDNPESSPRLFQQPIIRVPAQGRISVPLFAFLTGFVCAAKPLRIAYQKKNTYAAFQAITRSFFRRPWRLILPATLATFISFLFSVLGGYTSANRCDSLWIRYDAPNDLPFLLNLRRLAYALLDTWTISANPYDHHQWAMMHLLLAAFQVYGMLVMTMGVKMSCRLVLQCAMLLFWWLNRAPFTETIGCPLMLGLIIAELSQHEPTQEWIKWRPRLLSYLVAPFILLVGLYFGSYPQESPEWTPWSRQLYEKFVERGGSLLVPEGTDPRRRFTSVCVQLTVIALFLAPRWQEALARSRTLIWLGKHSFAVYLVHGTILRTIGVWIVYGIGASGRGEPIVFFNEHGEQFDKPPPEGWIPKRGSYAVIISIVTFTVLTYLVAFLWVKYVDSTCHKITLWLEQVSFDSDTKDNELAGSEEEKQNLTASIPV